MPLQKQCFAIFEGGGAKGITHLGALKALDDVEMTRLGVAGTSAGAIVAALSAVGYSAEELFSSATPADGEEEPVGWNILAKRGLRPIDLLGADDWHIFARRFRTRRSKAAQDVARLVRSTTLALASLVEPVWLVLFFVASRRLVRHGTIGAAWRVVEQFGFSRPSMRATY